jgi:hypothetical protein
MVLNVCAIQYAPSMEMPGISRILYNKMSGEDLHFVSLNKISFRALLWSLRRGDILRAGLIPLPTPHRTLGLIHISHIFTAARIFSSMRCLAAPPASVSQNDGSMLHARRRLGHKTAPGIHVAMLASIPAWHFTVSTARQKKRPRSVSPRPHSPKEP